MSFSLQKVIPHQVVAIGDDGKNKSSHLFDSSFETRWSYKGRFAYNVITLPDNTTLDSMTIYWYMKKKERRQYKFGVYTSQGDIAITGDFETTQKQIQELYNSADTIKSDNGEGNETTVINFDGKVAKTIAIIYTYSSSKKSWFSVKEIEINGRAFLHGAQNPDGKKWDDIAGTWKEIMPDIDELVGDTYGVMYWNDDYEYISENRTFSRNFRADGSMRMDIEPKDMGNKWRMSKEVVVFLKVSGREPTEEVSFKLDGGPHNDKTPKLGRCNIIGISYDMKRLRFRQELYHEKYEEREEIDISKLNLPPMLNMFYGFCVTDRLIKNKDEEPIGRLFNIRVNPSPFDFNRNVLNENWIDIGAFLSYGDKLIAGPVDPEKYVDTIRVDGQNASTFGYRWLRYCQIPSILAETEDDMKQLLSELREDVEEDAPNNDVNPAQLDVDEMPKLITVQTEGEMVVLHAKIKANPLITRVQWRQSAGVPIELPLEMINSSYVEFPYKKAYGNTEWTFSAIAQGGVTVFERTIKIMDAIDPSKKYIYPIYPDAKKDFHYWNIKNLVLADGEELPVDELWKNTEITTILNVPKTNVALPYIFFIGPFKYEIFSDGKFTSFENVFPYMVNVPSFKGKKIGLKVVVLRTILETSGPQGDMPATLTEVHLNLEPDKEGSEYSPWFKVIQRPDDKEWKVTITAPSRTKYDVIDIREIHAPSAVKNI
jgi:hypothetical protein